MTNPTPNHQISTQSPETSANRLGLNAETNLAKGQETILELPLSQDHEPQLAAAIHTTRMETAQDEITKGEAEEVLLFDLRNVPVSDRGGKSFNGVPLNAAVQFLAVQPGALDWQAGTGYKALRSGESFTFGRAATEHGPRDVRRRFKTADTTSRNHFTLTLSQEGKLSITDRSIAGTSIATGDRALESVYSVAEGLIDQEAGVTVKRLPERPQVSAPEVQAPVSENPKEIEPGVYEEAEAAQATEVAEPQPVSQVEAAPEAEPAEADSAEQADVSAESGTEISREMEQTFGAATQDILRLKYEVEEVVYNMDNVNRLVTSLQDGYMPIEEFANRLSAAYNQLDGTKQYLSTTFTRVGAAASALRTIEQQVDAIRMKLDGATEGQDRAKAETDHKTAMIKGFEESLGTLLDRSDVTLRQANQYVNVTINTMLQALGDVRQRLSYGQVHGEVISQLGYMMGRVAQETAESAQMQRDIADLAQRSRDIYMDLRTA